MPTKPYKPLSATLKDWKTWKETMKREHRVWYFFHETLPFEIGYYSRRLKDIKYWIAHRTYDRYHVIPVHGMKPGYADKDHLMLHAMFGLLVDFVECECGWMHYMSKHEYNVPFRWSDLLFWRHFKSPEDGLAHLDWEIGLKQDDTWGVEPGEPGYGEPTHQATSAVEKKALYLWYTQIRPNRPDPHDASGWSDVWDREGVPEDQRTAAALRSGEIETTYDQEDNDMLKRLVDIRLGLWT